MKKSKLLGITLILAVICTACGSTPKEPQNEPQSESQSTTEATAQQQDEVSEPWTSEGAYIDENGNHLILVHYSEEDAVGQVGWSVSAIIGDEMYGGFMDEVGSSLKGDIIAYDSNGNEKERKQISLTNADPYIVMVTDKAEVFQFTVDETDYTENVGETLPMFQYGLIHAYDGYDNLWAAAYNQLTFREGEAVTPENVLIPYVSIVDVDDSNPEDVLVYGDYYISEFEGSGDTLTCVSSSHIPGVIHMRRIGEGDASDYESLSMDKGLTDDEVKDIFGQYYDHYLTLSSDPQAVDSGIAANIADYVKANGLSFTKYALSDGSVQDIPKSFISVLREGTKLPDYEYPDPSSKEYAVYQYLLQDYNEMVNTSLCDVTIPYALIFAEDEKNPDDIVVMLTGWISSYNQEDGVLEMQSGSEWTGAVHLKKTSDGYEGMSLEALSDGSEYDPSAKRIFGSHYDDFKKITREDLNKIQKQVISDYVTSNGLDINSYQDLGSDPVSID